MLRCKTQVIPEKPIVIYDGKCGFCSKSVEKWKKLVDRDIQFISCDHSSISMHYPELLTEDLQTSVHYIDGFGQVYIGAEAVLLILKNRFIFSILLRLYQKSSLFARLSEAIYAWIARHRYGLSCAMGP